VISPSLSTASSSSARGDREAFPLECEKLGFDFERREHRYAPPVEGDRVVSGANAVAAVILYLRGT